MKDKGGVFSQRLLKWFSSNARSFPWRQETDPYRILVAEKLLQQTTYGHVLKVYDLFFEKFPNIQSLAQAEASDIESAIRRLGFQRQRSKQFKEIGLAVMNTYGGEIPSNKEELLSLSGIGNYVANAVLCFAFGKEEAIVDINVRRVVRRFFLWQQLGDEEIERRLKVLMPKGRAKEFNWGMIDFSAKVCSRKPKCKRCCMAEFCEYFQRCDSTSL